MSQTEKQSAHEAQFSLRRLQALCIKESKQILRDPSSALIAVVIPLMLLFIFGYGINLDSSKLRLGILVNQQNNQVREFVATFTGSPFIDATISDNRKLLIDKMQAGEIRGMVVIPVDFASQLNRPLGHASIQVITDGSEPNTAYFVQAYANKGIWQTWQQQQGENAGYATQPLIVTELRFWFNPAAISQHFIIPGAISIIITVVDAILTSLVGCPRVGTRHNGNPTCHPNNPHRITAFQTITLSIVRHLCHATLHVSHGLYFAYSLSWFTLVVIYYYQSLPGYCPWYGITNIYLNP